MIQSNIFNLNMRHLQPEKMDAPDVDPKAHSEALEGLARVNHISRSAEAVWAPLKDIVMKKALSQPLRILDVASGGGDVAIQLKQISEKEGTPIVISGCDKSETAIRYAREKAASAQVTVDFFRHDIFQDALPGSYDVITCNLFLHHLSEEALLRWMKNLKTMQVHYVIASDLNRSILGFLAAYIASRLLTRSPIVHFDAVQSVRNAFRVSEVKKLAEEAGWKQVRIRKMWPFHFQLIGKFNEFESA